MRNIEENIATGTQGDTNNYTGKNTALETTNTHKRKSNHGENIPDPRSNQRDVSSNNKRRKHDDPIDNTVTNQQDRNLKNKANLHIDERCKKRQYLIPSNNRDTSNTTDQIKQFKILLCEISSKIEKGWQLDVSCSAVDNLRNGKINFTKEAGQKKLYSFYEVKCIADTKSSKDAKLNYVTFRSDMVQKCFERYLNFCNMPPDSLTKFKVCCNIKLNTDAFNKQGIDIELLGSSTSSSTYKLEIQESYKNNIEKLGLYKTFLRCCTLPKLANLLIDCMKNNKAHFNTVLLKKWLSTFIKEKILKKEDKKDKYILKFHHDFIEGNNLTYSAIELRSLFLSKSMNAELGDWMEFTVSKMTFKTYEEYSVEPLPVEMPVDMFHTFLKIFRFKVVNNIDAIVEHTIGSAVYIDSLAKELTSTPLHLKMLFEINSHHKQNIAYTELRDLYEKYVELKIHSDDIYTFAELSAQQILSKKDFKLLNPDFREKNLKLLFPEDLQHVTIYEYFTARWLSVEFFKKVNNRRKILTVTNKLFCEKSVFLSVFLDPPGKENELIDSIAKYGCLNLLKFFLSDKVIITQKPNLHRVIKYNKTNAYEVLKYLIERYKHTNGCQFVEYINQQIDGETPMQLSCRLQKMDLACELMLEGADVKCLNQDSLLGMTIHVIRELTRGNFRFKNILEGLLELLSEASLTYLSKKSKYPKLIKYLLERGQKTMIERLLRKKTNRKELLAMRVDGKSTLDLVNNSLDSDKRLEMYKYIIENVGDELKQENKYFIEPVLRGACETDCKEIFNYFVDRYPGKVNGFLNKALRDNRSRDVKFVVGISKRQRIIDQDGDTLLHRAIRFKAKDDIIDFLIDRIGLYEVNRNKRTALHVAFKTGQKFPRIKHLIKQGASLLATDKYGLYPWCYALLDKYCDYDSSSSDELTEIMNYLIKEKNIEPPTNASLGSKATLTRTK